VSPVAEWRFLVEGQAFAHRQRPRLRTTTNDSAIAAAVAGLGIARLLSYQVAAHLLSGALEIVLGDFELDALPVHVVHPEGRRASQRVRRFVELAVAALHADPTLR